jgi:hypothetical protein
MRKIGRPKVKNRKENISLSINTQIDDILTEYLKDKDMTKSQYVEHLIKKDREDKK